MKIVITGGKKSIIKPGHHVMQEWLHDYFSKHEVIQLSRETGYDLDKQYDEIVKIAQSADVFVNSACVKDYQIKLLEDVYSYVPYLICVGSIAGDFHEAPQKYENHSNYAEVKHRLKERCKWLPLETLDTKTKLLHLNITETVDPNYDVAGLKQIELNDILDFWFKNPIMSNIDFKFFTESYHYEGKKEKIKKVVEYYDSRHKSIKD
jgi:methyl coenzyme M reductase subunit C-like uncharacterized protein (methanogenesis marker protein 7)